MKQAKKIPSVPPLSPDATDDEIVEWVTRYSLDDRLAAGVTEIVEDHSDLDRLLQERKATEVTAQLTLRVPSSMKSALQRIARRQTTRASTLARRWLAERLQQELQTQRRSKPRRSRLRASS
jgi:hypothetical protein